jgi:hypothetical protein
MGVPSYPQLLQTNSKVDKRSPDFALIKTKVENKMDREEIEAGIC